MGKWYAGGPGPLAGKARTERDVVAPVLRDRAVEDHLGARIDVAGYLAIVVSPGEHFVTRVVVGLPVRLWRQRCVSEEQRAVVAVGRFPATTSCATRCTLSFLGSGGRSPRGRRTCAPRSRSSTLPPSDSRSSRLRVLRTRRPNRRPRSAIGRRRLSSSATRAMRATGATG